MMSLCSPPTSVWYQRLVHRAGVVLLPTLCLAATAAPAGAQVMIGANRTQVFVNSDVLDSLGPPPTLPRLFEANPGQSPRQLRQPAARSLASEGNLPRSRIYAAPSA